MDRQLAYQMEFLEACSLGDVDKTRLLINSGHVDCNFHHRVNGWTALHWAARRGHENITRLLLETGFDPKAITKDGKTAADVAQKETVKSLISTFAADNVQNDFDDEEMVKLNESNGMKQRRNSSSNNNNVSEENGGGQVPPGYVKDSQFRLSASFDSAASPPPESPTTPVKAEVYSYGRRDSLNRTRFLLVRTSSGNGKESFKRVTLPGGGSVEFLKLTIERAMKQGRVVQVITLPEGIPIETDEQIRNLTDSQKVEVVFEPYNDHEQKAGSDRKLSLTESTRFESNRGNRAPRLHRKAVSMMEDFGREDGVKALNGVVHGERPLVEEGHRITLDCDDAHAPDGDTTSTDSSLSSAVASELEESTSSNCSFSASSSYAKARSVLAQQQVMKNSIDVSVAEGDEKEYEEKKEVVQVDAVIKLQSPEKPEEPMEEEVSCEFAFKKSVPDSENVDLSLIQITDGATANGGFAVKKFSQKASQILGRFDDLDVVERAEKDRHELQRNIFFAVAAGVAAVGVGGAVWYYFHRNK